MGFYSFPISFGGLGRYEAAEARSNGAGGHPLCSFSRTGFGHWEASPVRISSFFLLHVRPPFNRIVSPALGTSSSCRSSFGKIGIAVT